MNPEITPQVNDSTVSENNDNSIRQLLAERDALRNILLKILENEATDYKFVEEFGGYLLDDELREEALAALAMGNKTC